MGGQYCILLVAHFPCSASPKTATPRTLGQAPGEMETCLKGSAVSAAPEVANTGFLGRHYENSSPTDTKKKNKQPHVDSEPDFYDIIHPLFLYKDWLPPFRCPIFWAMLDPVSVPRCKRNKAARTRWSSPACDCVAALLEGILGVQNSLPLLYGPIWRFP